MILMLAIPAVGLTLLSIACFFGRWSWALDVMANFRVQYAAALAIMALFLYFGRWRRTAAVVAVGAIVNLAVVVPLYFGGGPDLATVPSLRVMTFNLLASNDQFGAVAALIRFEEPDIVLLHEASRPWEAAMTGAGLDYEVTTSRDEGQRYGTLVLSRPGDRVTSFGATVGSPRAVEIVHEGVAVLGIHPLAPYSAERSALRDAQMEFASDWADDQALPHIVAGDFNATPWSYPFRKLLAETDLVNSQKGFGIQPTFPSGRAYFLRIPIDHLLHSPDLTVADRRLGPRSGSDHLPLLVDLWVGGTEPTTTTVP